MTYPMDPEILDNDNEDAQSISSEDIKFKNREEKINHILKINSATSSGPCYNAVTRQPYPFSVSSKQSKQLFIVHKSTGKYGSRDPQRQFYDSPEQYEKHCHKGKRVVDESVRTKFHERQLTFIEATA